MELNLKAIVTKQFSEINFSIGCSEGSIKNMNRITVSQPLDQLFEFVGLDNVHGIGVGVGLFFLSESDELREECSGGDNDWISIVKAVDIGIGQVHDDLKRMGGFRLLLKVLQGRRQGG